MRGICLALLLLSLTAAPALGEGVMLGVHVTYTPAPTDTPAPEQTMDTLTAPEAATPAEAAPVTQEQMDAAGLGERILMRGMEGDDVVLLQERLYELGYYLGEVDGVFGLQTRTAVYAFQRAHKLEKIDGKVGPETIRRMFAQDAIIKPTPTPSPTPRPTATPVPTPTPTPTPAPTLVPDRQAAPFALEERKLYIGENETQLLLGVSEEGDILYPLCGVMQRMRYRFSYTAGSWMLMRVEDGSEIALMTAGQEGLCEGAMGSFEGVLFLADAESRVYAYAQEAYVTEALLEQLGLTVLIVEGTPVIH